MSSTEKKQVLIVEDEQDLLTILQIRLSRDNYEVFTAPDGEAGLELAQTIKPDVVVLDIMMPGKDGYSLLRDLKGNEETCHIPVIVVTARDRIEEPCALEGAERFLVKPYEYSVLQESIRELTAGV